MTESSWELIGPIILTQIHTDRMVSGGHYDHQLLVEVDQLQLSAAGIVGTVGGRALLHGHHREHPNKTRLVRPRRFRPNRLVSLGFTSHYDSMAGFFGQAPLGCAAEDIVVKTSKRIVLDDLAGGVQIRSSQSTVHLDSPLIAEPCTPFVNFMLPDDKPELVDAAREFLSNGMRGFVLGATTLVDPATVQTGHQLWARTRPT